MSYQVLARKWRPHNFKDMVGQEHILRMLANALEQQRIHHAYLFTGTRGVGKTTIARIFAKCLNCESGVTATPCDKCHACQAIDAGRFLDLYEVDAASRTKVEDTRELLDNVCYPPSQGRYKIYLIDEVHMLSNHSFNALLKTLEEPPEHVKFLLATTDPKRLPITILSRCLQFNLKRITAEQIASHLQHICEVEKLSSEYPALEKLAKSADGSMRDALSLLDQAIAYGNGTVNKNDVNAMLGSMAQDDLMPLIETLAAQNGKELFAAITHLSECAPDFHEVLEEIISIFHQIAITQIAPGAITVSEAITELAKQFSPEDVQLYYQIALLGRRDLSLTPTPLHGFQMTMLRMLAFHPENKQTERAATPAKKTVPVKSVEAKPAAIATPTPEKTAENVVATAGLAEWRDMLPKLELSGMSYALASNCTLVSITDDKVELALSANHLPMLNDKLKDRMAEALSRVLNRSIQLTINPTSAEIITPVKLQQSENNQRVATATQKIMQDPKIKALVDMYDATIDVSLA